MIEKSFHDISYEETEKLLNTSITSGLKAEEIETRRVKYGANEIEKKILISLLLITLLLKLNILHQLTKLK